MTSSRKQILIAHSDPLLIQFLAPRCKDIGLEPKICNDTKSALSAILEKSPDLIVTSPIMAVAESMTICDALDKDDEASKIPVITIQEDNMSPVTSCDRLCIYNVRRTRHLWKSIAPVIHELVDLRASSKTRSVPQQ